MDSFTLSDDFLDDFLSALELDNIPTVLRFNGEREELSVTPYENLVVPADIAVEAGNPTKASTPHQDRVWLNPVAFHFAETESRTFPEDLELGRELATAAFDSTQLELQVDPVPSFSTPGFVALQRSQVPVIFDHRSRKPREYVPRS